MGYSKLYCCNPYKILPNFLAIWCVGFQNCHLIRIVSKKMLMKWVEVQYKHIEYIITCMLNAWLHYYMTVYCDIVMYHNFYNHTKYNLIQPLNIIGQSVSKCKCHEPILSHIWPLYSWNYLLLGTNASPGDRLFSSLLAQPFTCC